MNVAISIILTLALLFGGTATVAAAQDDLPNQPLYPLRIASEDMQLWFNNDAQQEIDLLMAFVQARIQEMAALAEMGITPPVQVAERMNLHIQLALQTAAGMDQSEMEGALLRIRTTLQEQEQIMTMLQLGATGETSQVVAQTRLMLENRIRQVDDGIADPQGFQSATRAEQEQRTGQTETPSTPQGNGPGPNPVETPPSSPGGHGNGSGGQGGNP